MKNRNIIKLFIGSIAIKKWHANFQTDKETEVLTIGTKEDECEFCFDEFPSKQNISNYHKEFNRLQNNSSKFLKDYKKKYQKDFESIISKLKTYESIEIYFASGGLFSSFFVFILIQEFENIKVTTSVMELSTPSQNYVIDYLENYKTCSVNIVGLFSEKDEFMDKYLERLDIKMIKVIDKKNCANCIHFLQTGMSTNMGGEDCGYCNVLRKNKSIKLSDSIKWRNDNCSNFFSFLHKNYDKIFQLEKEKAQCISNGLYEQAAIIRDRIRALKE